MEESPYCKNCSAKKLVYNLWGYPDPCHIKELESLGFRVKIHGCVPPVIESGKEHFLFECRKCGHRYGDPFSEGEEDSVTL